MGIGKNLFLRIFTYLTHFAKCVLSIFLAFIFIQACIDRKEIIKGKKDGRDFEFELVNGRIVHARELDSLGNLFALHLVDDQSLTFKDSSIFYRATDKTVSAVQFYDTNNDLFYQKEYAPDGQLVAEGGITNDQLLDGLYTFYDKNGIRREQVEYLTQKDSSIINSIYAFDENGRDTIYEKSKFYRFFFPKDTVTLGEGMIGKVTLAAPYYKSNKSEMLMVWPKNPDEQNFTANFDNINEIELDTVPNMNNNEEFRDRFGLEGFKLEWSQITVFGRYFHKKGNQKIRGILVEYVVNDTTPEGLYKVSTDHTYFEKDIYVKDTVE